MAIVEVNYDFIIKVLEHNKDNVQWRRVRNLVCVHTFIGDFYINICHFLDENDNKAMSINVDNFKHNKNDLVDSSFVEGSDQYNVLYSIYENALKTCVRVRSAEVV